LVGCTDIEIQQAPHQEVLPQIYRGTPRVCNLNPHTFIALVTHRIVLAYLRDLTHGFALCDRDMVRIVGKWYRCAFCAKDLCADCEALDSHDDTHVFLVFKAPVHMDAFRCAVRSVHISYIFINAVVLTIDVSPIWKTQLVVHLCYTETSISNDMTNITLNSCFAVFHRYVCGCPFVPNIFCRDLLRMDKVM